MRPSQTATPRPSGAPWWARSNGPFARRKAGRGPWARGGAARNASLLSLFSVGSALSILSMRSAGSILSIGSIGSVLSIGSAGSILSIGSAGSILSIGSTGGVLRIGGRRSALERRRHAMHPRLPATTDAAADHAPSGADV